MGMKRYTEIYSRYNYIYICVYITYHILNVHNMGPAYCKHWFTVDLALDKTASLHLKEIYYLPSVNPGFGNPNIYTLFISFGVPLGLVWLRILIYAS